MFRYPCFSPGLNIERSWYPSASSSNLAGRITKHCYSKLRAKKGDSVSPEIGDLAEAISFRYKRLSTTRSGCMDLALNVSMLQHDLGKTLLSRLVLTGVLVHVS